MFLVFVLVLGLLIGSFLSAYTYRLPKNISISNGRSMCPNCHHLIYWYDNIPLISFLLLKGACRNCHKKISTRYPLIEFSTSLTFVLIYELTNFHLLMMGEIFTTIFLLIIASVSIGIIVIDIEHQIIPDEFVWVLFLISLGIFFISPEVNFFERLLSGFGASLFLLLLNLITKGKGMGLGDVKLAIPLGFLLGFPNVIVWLFSSFILGSVIGIIAILLQKSKLKAKIAFGPFLIIGFWITLLFSPILISIIMPYYI